MWSAILGTIAALAVLTFVQVGGTRGAAALASGLLAASSLLGCYLLADEAVRMSALMLGLVLGMTVAVIERSSSDDPGRSAERGPGRSRMMVVANVVAAAYLLVLLWQRALGLALLE